MADKVCSFCGSAVLPGSIFCDQCGTDLRQNQPAAKPVSVDPGFQTMIGMEGLPEPESNELLPPFHVPVVNAPPLQSLTGRLVLQNSNISLDLPGSKSEAFVGREDPAGGFFPEINLDPYGAQESGVSRRHVKIFISVGKLFIEDLHSVNGTYLNRRKLEPGIPAPLAAGDEIRLGKLTMEYLGN